MIGFVGMPGLFELLVLAAFVLVPVLTVLIVLRLNKRRDADFPTNPNLAPCPDCGHQVSIYAATCPQCGRPLH